MCGHGRPPPPTRTLPAGASRPVQRACGRGAWGRRPRTGSHGRPALPACAAASGLRGGATVRPRGWALRRRAAARRTLPKRTLAPPEATAKALPVKPDFGRSGGPSAAWTPRPEPGERVYGVAADRSGVRPPGPNASRRLGAKRGSRIARAGRGERAPMEDAVRDRARPSSSRAPAAGRRPTAPRRARPGQIPTGPVRDAPVPPARPAPRRSAGDRPRCRRPARR